MDTITLNLTESRYVVALCRYKNFSSIPITEQASILGCDVNELQRAVANLTHTGFIDFATAAGYGERYDDPYFAIECSIYSDKDMLKREGLFPRPATLKTYGLNEDDYMYLLQRQQSTCALCKCTPRQHGKPLYIDHCHKTGIVRGLLCSRCNSNLGRVESGSIPSKWVDGEHYLKYKSTQINGRIIIHPDFRKEQTIEV